MVHDVIYTMTSYLLSGYRGICTSYPGENHSEIVIYLSTCSDCRARVTGIDLLLDGYGGGYARDEIDIGLVDTPQELTGVGREALHITTLSLGKYCVESQGRFARPRKTRDDGQRVVRYREVNIFQVMNSRALDKYRFVL